MSVRRMMVANLPGGHWQSLGTGSRSFLLPRRLGGTSLEFLLGGIRGASGSSFFHSTWKFLVVGAGPLQAPEPPGPVEM